jgi:hypothetical protein
MSKTAASAISAAGSGPFWPPAGVGLTLLTRLAFAGDHPSGALELVAAIGGLLGAVLLVLASAYVLHPRRLAFSANARATLDAIRARDPQILENEDLYGTGWSDLWPQTMLCPTGHLGCIRGQSVVSMYQRTPGHRKLRLNAPAATPKVAARAKQTRTLPAISYQEEEEVS